METTINPIEIKKEFPIWKERFDFIKDHNVKEAATKFNCSQTAVRRSYHKYEDFIKKFNDPLYSFVSYDDRLYRILKFKAFAGVRRDKCILCVAFAEAFVKLVNVFKRALCFKHKIA